MMLLHAEYQKDGLGKPLDCQLFCPNYHKLNHFACGLENWHQGHWIVQGGYMGMFKLLQGCKAKPCESLGPASALHHDRDSTMFRMEEAVPTFSALTFPFFTDTYTVFDDLCHREMIKIQSSVKV